MLVGSVVSGKGAVVRMQGTGRCCGLATKACLPPTRIGGDKVCSKPVARQPVISPQGKVARTTSIEVA